ncbi:MAG: hypothetical protein C4519_03405 [Desulfobacteraceae bacterium]|nr:MAG: hypothetical protein C4519_03405 [Desulfobacteraceae bacterium]
MKSILWVTVGFWIAMGVLMALVAEAPAAETLSPARQKMAWAQKQIQKEPGRFQPYNALALALAQRARETGDPQYYVQAEKTLGRSLKLAPDNFEARKIQVWLLLGRHEFGRALNAAKRLNQRMPDDIMVYAMLADAHVELGNYADAEAAAQWMLDLRPGNVPGLTRAAYLRELFGDIDGAVDLMVEAYQRTPGQELEERAWLLTHIGKLHLSVGKADSAVQLLHKALELFPDYHYALAALAQVEAERQNHAAAAQLLRKQYQLAPHPENLYLWAQALERIGKADEASAAYQKFAAQALLESHQPDNANRELIFYYTDKDHKPAAALRIAQLEIGRRQDVFTRDALAWAFFANADFQEARRHIETALAVGIRDARIFYHAGAIAAKQGDRRAAEEYYRKANELNPNSQWADAARKATAALRGHKENGRG